MPAGAVRRQSCTCRSSGLQLPLSLADHWLEVFKTYYGPTNQAFASGALRADILELVARLGIRRADALVVPSKYPEVVATKD